MLLNLILGEKDYSWFYLNGSALSDRVIRVKDKSKRVIATRYNWVRPLHRGDRVIEVKISVFKGKELRDFDNWPQNTVWPLNTKYYISVIS